MTDGRGERRSGISYDLLILGLALLAGLPGSSIALILLWLGEYSARLQWTLTTFIGIGWFGFAVVLRERVVRSLQTLSNMLAALHKGDYSMRARGLGSSNDSLGLALLEANTLGETLHQQRLGALEATALLRKVMEEIDVAVLAFDDALTLQPESECIVEVSGCSANPRSASSGAPWRTLASKTACTVTHHVSWKEHFRARPGGGK